MLVGKGAESSCRAWPDLETGSQSGGISGSDPMHRTWWPPRSNHWEAPPLHGAHVESRCGAVTLGRTYPLPPLSSGGALVVTPSLRFHANFSASDFVSPTIAATELEFLTA